MADKAIAIVRRGIAFAVPVRMSFVGTPPVFVRSIIRREIRERAELVGLQQLDLASLPGNQSAPSQLLDGAIDVDDRQSAGIGDVPLRHRHLEAAVLDEAHDLQPCGELADQMGHLRQCRLCAEARDPLSRDRRIDQRLAPERAGQVNGAVEQLLELAVCDVADEGRAKTDEVRIHRRDQQRVEARHVAGNVEGEDLAAIADDARLIEEAADDENAARGIFTLAQQGLAVGDLAQRGRQSRDLAAFVVGEAFNRLEMCDELGVRHGEEEVFQSSPGIAGSSRHRESFAMVQSDTGTAWNSRMARASS